MSWQVYKRIWNGAKEITQSDKVLLMALAEHADEDGICWPSYDTLADMIGVNRRSAIRIVEKLEGSGHVFIDEHVTGRGNSNRFFVTSGLIAFEIENILINRFEKSQAEADLCAQIILNKQDEHKKGVTGNTKSFPKGVTDDTNYQVKGVTDDTNLEQEKGVTGDKKVLPVTQKGVTGNTRTIMNHHLEPPFKERESRTRTETHFQKLKRIGEVDFLAQNEAFAVRLTEICGNPHPKFVVNSERHKLANATAQLLDWHVTIADLDDFITGYWWGNAPPRYDQVTGDWGRFLTNKQQSQKASKNGRHNNKRQNEPQPSQATGLGEWTDEQKAELRAAGIPITDDS